MGYGGYNKPDSAELIVLVTNLLQRSNLSKTDNGDLKVIFLDLSYRNRYTN